MKQPRVPKRSKAAKHRLPSGRMVTARAEGERESVEIRSAEGALELRIVLTEKGPMLVLENGRLALSTPDAVALECRKFEVHASEGIRMTSKGEVAIHGDRDLHLHTTGEVHIDGDFINLNCKDRAGYHDESPSEAEPSA